MLGLGLRTVNPVVVVNRPPLVLREFFVQRVDDTDAAEYTFAGVTLPRAGRLIVGVGYRSTTSSITVSSITAGGEAMSELEFDAGGGGTNAAGMYEIELPAGATGNIVVTLSGTAQRCGVGIWGVYGAQGDAVVGSGATHPFTDTLGIPANGVAIGYSLCSNSSALTCAWTNLGERFDGAVETVITHSGADAAFADGGSTALTATWSGTPSLGGAAVFAAWGPISA